MDKEELQQKIAEYYSKLPVEAQEVFSSMQWLETLRVISIKYELNDKQIETLSTETTLLLLGILSSAEYKDIIENELNISKDSLDKILEEINDSILKEILPKLEETFYQNNQEDEKGSPVEQKLDDRFSKLPEETQNAIKLSGYEASLYEISKKYNLTVSQMDILGKSVTNVLSGTVSSEEFPNSIKYLNLPTEKFTTIINDINEKIFIKIRETLIGNTEKQKVFKEIEQPIKIESREELLKSIENPELIVKKTAPVILDAKNEIASGEKLEIEAPAEMPVKIKEEVPSILSKKLSESFQIPMVQTDHSLKNIQPSSQNNTVLKAKVDPYREIPE